MVPHLVKKFQAFCRNRTCITMSKTAHRQNKVKYIYTKFLIPISKFFWSVSPNMLYCTLRCSSRFVDYIFIQMKQKFVARWKYWHPCNYQNLKSIFQVLFEIFPKLIISESPNLLTHIFPLYRIRYSGSCI